MRRIIITLIDGQVIYVSGLTEPYEIEVRDYDVPEDWDDGELSEYTDVDDDGERYQSYTVPANVSSLGQASVSVANGED